jgi:hypothetical protein
MSRLRAKSSGNSKKNTLKGFLIKFLLLFKKAEVSTDCYNGGYTVVKAKKLFGKIYITKRVYLRART